MRRHDNAVEQGSSVAERQIGVSAHRGRARRASDRRAGKVVAVEAECDRPRRAVPTSIAACQSSKRKQQAEQPPKSAAVDAAVETEQTSAYSDSGPRSPEGLLPYLSPQRQRPGSTPCYESVPQQFVDAGLGARALVDALDDHGAGGRQDRARRSSAALPGSVPGTTTA